MFNCIPDEMKVYRQFVVWKFEEIQDGKLTKVPYCPHTGHLASVTDPSTWGTFQDALNAVNSYSGIGFVLTQNDPYTFIDLDAPKEHLSEQEKQIIFDRQLKIYSEFDSYSERSPSGNGLHIIVKGSVPSGRKRSAVELYSNVRYMTMTGNVYKASPIMERQELINVLWEQMGGSAATNTYNGDEPEKESDEAIIEKACNASNGQKFMALLQDRWEEYYPSQSEADFAFIDIISFYTQNAFQITRLFRNSPLGQRAKALRADYVNYMINKSFDRMLPPVDVDGLKNQLEAALAEKSQDCLKNGLPNFHSGGTLELAPALTLPKKTKIKRAYVPASPYSVPPGLLGEIAQFIHAAAPRPVPEIALAGAIGLMAGICGRAFNISGTGLNQYVLLLAPTGTGKEAIASGIDKLMGTVQRTVPSANEFVGPAEISSPQALIKYMSKTSKSFVSLVGEFGLMLKKMSAHNADSNQIGLRRVLLDLYNKSGEGKILRPTIYSDRDKNTDPILAPAFTMLGESAPENFYATLHEGMISEGLLPRFTIIEYHGDRPPLNKNHLHCVPSFKVITDLSTLCAHALMLTNANKSVNVVCNDEAKKLFEDFDNFCDTQINAANSEVTRHLWNRAHIKAMKLAALVAVGNNPYEPTIDNDSATWALNIIVADVHNMLKRFEAGEIGADTEETRQIEEVCRVFREYVTKGWNDIDRYKSSNPKLHDDRIVTFSYINKRLSACSAFRKDRLGAAKALARTIETLKQQGDIRELGVKQVADKYGYTGKCYAISNPVIFKL